MELAQASFWRGLVRAFSITRESHDLPLSVLLGGVLLHSMNVLITATELEAVPMRAREHPEFIAKSKHLARMLGLTAEWWTCNHVNDANRSPCHPPEYVAFADWHRCRAMRLSLLEATRPRPGGENMSTLLETK
jgi:hypothetical protein